MPKLKSPLISLSASGRFSKLFTFLRRRHTNIIESTPTIDDVKSLAQLSWRHMYLKAVALWHALSDAEKQEWESLARPKHMTGFAYFISLALKPNPGLYLPLQGGKMSGDIDMDGNKIENLPAPVADQEPATKKYVDDLPPGGIPGEGHITILPWSYNQILQGSWSRITSGYQWTEGALRNSTHNDGDSLTFKLYLDSGTYTLLLFTRKSGDMGIVDFDIDAVEVASFDLYRSPTLYNARLTQAGITIATAALYTLKLRIDGKNPSSSNHYVWITYIALWRTA